MMADQPERLLTSREYAQVLGISTERLYKLNEAGELPIKPLRVGKRLLRWSLSEHNRAVREAARTVSHPFATMSPEEDKHG